MLLSNLSLPLMIQMLLVCIKKYIFVYKICFIQLSDCYPQILIFWSAVKSAALHDRLINSIIFPPNFKGLRLGVFPNRIQVDSIKIIHKSIKLNFDSKYFQDRPKKFGRFDSIKSRSD